MQPSERDTEPQEPVDLMEVKPNIPFHPFEGLDEWYSVEQRRSDPEIPWYGNETIYLRRKINYKGVAGFVDLIDENYGYNDYDIIKKVGGADFTFETTEGDGIIIEEEITSPLIVRLAFFLKKPRDFMAIVSTNIQLILEDGRYQLLYTVDAMERNFQESIELDGEKILVRDGFLKVDGVMPLGEENVRAIVPAGRVWFPIQEDEIDKIEMIFETDDKRDDENNLPVTPPLKSRELVSA